MKSVFILAVGLALVAGPVLGATPTPIPTPSPTPFPDIIPQYGQPVNVNAYVSFTTATDYNFTNHRTLQPLTVPSGHTLYITDINWSCTSTADAEILWSSAGTKIDEVNFPNTGQGKSASYRTPLYSVSAADYPILRVNTASSGVVFLGGYIE